MSTKCKCGQGETCSGCPAERPRITVRELALAMMYVANLNTYPDMSKSEAALLAIGHVYGFCKALTAEETRCE